MTSTTITNLRKKLFAYVNQAITYNDPVSIVTKEGNAVIISEEEYHGMLATLALMEEPGLVESIRKGMKEKDGDCEVYNPEDAW